MLMRRILALACSALLALGSGTTLRAQTSRSISVAVAADPERLYRPTTISGRLAANLVFDPLVGLDDTMTPYPALAATVPSPDNGLITVAGTGADRRLVVTMPLRTDVTWSDGAPFTADDVVYTWALMMNPRSGFATTAEDALKSVEKVDDATVRFTYLSGPEAHAQFPDRYPQQGNEPVMQPLALFGLYDAPAIYPRHVLRDLVDDDPRNSPRVGALDTSAFARAPVGTGPYVLAGSDADTGVTFTSRGLALPQRLGVPAFDTVVMRIYADRTDALAALGAGQVQVIAQGSLGPADATTLDTSAGVRTRYTPSAAWEHLTLNLDNAILSDSRVRQAIAVALDRGALNGAALAGKGQVQTGLFPSWSWAFTPNSTVASRDLGQARALLDSAGWTVGGADGIRTKNGKRMSLQLRTTPAPFRSTLTPLIHDQLAALGLDLVVEIVPKEVLFDPTGAVPQALVNRSFDIAEFAWVDSYDAGTDMRNTLHASTVPSPTNAFRGGNYGNYRSPRVDTLLDQVQFSLDPTVRRTALMEAQAIVQSDVPVIPLLLRPTTTATSSLLVNFRPTPAPAGETWNIEQWDMASP
ncbi:MAG: peptide-binding protein [Chloroflexota bacterium]